MQQVELREATGAPAQTTLRAQLQRLVEVAAIEKRRRNRFPGVLEYELSSTGRDLLDVTSVLERWLSRAPDRRLAIDDDAARNAIKALVAGWSTSMLRALAARPLSLTELDSVIGSLSYPALERRLAALRLSGQVERIAPKDRATPYAVTQWLRQGMAPLLASVQWEHLHLPNQTPTLSRVDFEAALLLAVPLPRLPSDLNGVCRLVLELAGERRPLVGVTARVEAGAVGECSTKLDRPAEAWALGRRSGWLSALVDDDQDRLEVGGDGHLVRGLLSALHSHLYDDAMPDQTSLDASKSIREDRSN
jgi:DNA-binding HxlR family transcriptional regulator